jgi:hypothetical protein
MVTVRHSGLAPALLRAAASPTSLVGGLDPGSDRLPFLGCEPLGRIRFGLVVGQGTRTGEVVFSTLAGVEVPLLPASLAGSLADARRELWTTDVVRTVAQQADSILGFLLVEEVVAIDENYVSVLRVEYRWPRQLG